jgi:DNA helicase-2/ATP-dependent DNA helicase PcrA
LSYHQAELFNPKKMIVIVPEEGLVRLTRSILEELSMETVRVTTVDQWFAEQARAIFPDLPERLAVTTPAAVIRLKRHQAFCGVLGRVADEAGLLCAEEIDRSLEAGNRFVSLYTASDGEFPLGRLETAFDEWSCDESADRVNVAKAAFSESVTVFSSAEADRERILGDRNLLEHVVAQAGGDLPNHVVDRALAHSRLQYSATAEEEFALIPEHRKRAVDGRPLDSGTPTEDAGSIDVEDFALLLELRRRKSGLSLAQERTASAYSHVVLDEAQELSQVELLVLGQTIAADGCVTVAGDPGQQIGIGADFGGWDGVMRALGQQKAAPVTLETSYRCTRPIVEFGHRVLGPLAPERIPIAAKEGAEIVRTEVPSEMHASLVLGDSLSDLLSRESGAQVAVIAREDDTARRLYAALHQHLAVRLVLDGRFSFKPGIDITSVSQVKGLEFDYVVIPDASETAYPPDHQSRRMLHVAATRAIHQLWLLTDGSWSQLVLN